MGALRRFNRLSLWFGGSLILLAAILIGIDVLMRRFFSASIGGADELSGYALAIGTTWGLGGALLDRAHIRIDSFYTFLPLKVRLGLDVFGLVLFIAFFSLIAWYGWDVVYQSWVVGSRSQSSLEVPIVIPQFIWFLGLIVFVGTGVVLLVRALIVGVHGDLDGTAQLISTRSAKEDVDEEIQDLRRRQSEGTAS